MSFIKDLKERELFYASTDEKILEEHLTKDKPRTFYVGFDPTADSLHVGSLLQIITMARLQKLGHRPIALVGGGTGMIGDPSGKSNERTFLTNQTLEKNVQGLKNQLSMFLDMDDPKTGALVLNNIDWLGQISLIDFLRDVGKNFSVNAMMAKDSVKSRLENREQGISYTEFSYMLLQSYDFVHLFDAHDCTLQMGGSDQWGNITAGIDLIRRMKSGQSYGITIPLLVNSSGTKFGKTEAGTVWLDSAKTSPYQFYQFWVRSEDADVIKFLKYFTFISLEEIAEIEKDHLEQPHARNAGKRLAKELTLMVHGQSGFDMAIRASKALFGGDLSQLGSKELEEIFSDVPSYSVDNSIFDQGIGLLDLMAQSKFVKSKGEARRLIKGGGFYLNNEKEQNPDAILIKESLLDGKFLILRAGKKRYFIIKS
jgi:tyrosyl-tRNA synthetase